MSGGAFDEKAIIGCLSAAGIALAGLVALLFYWLGWRTASIACGAICVVGLAAWGVKALAGRR
jgi:hypothetical protein